MTELRAIADDLRAEQQALDDVVADLSDGQWRQVTPSPGWSVSDQIGHLTYFDHTAATGVVARAGQPQRQLQAALGQVGPPGAIEEVVARAGADMGAADHLQFAPDVFDCFRCLRRTAQPRPYVVREVRDLPKGVIAAQGRLLQPFEIGQRAVAQGTFVSGAQDHAGGLAGLECFLPAGRTEAPTVAGFEAAKAEFRNRC